MTGHGSAVSFKAVLADLDTLCGWNGLRGMLSFSCQALLPPRSALRLLRRGALESAVTVLADCGASHFCNLQLLRSRDGFLEILDWTELEGERSSWSIF